ncbi:HEPN domain-containing protein [Candidatus Gottesmanbacteria bacterium]|nr:HEPN domain-containing protein [Candidatus Gottesmanbacteria bacterium]
MKAETGVWFAQAKEHYEDAQYLYDGSRYSMAVYCCHQTLEKILKACIVEYKDTLPPKIHKLDTLAEQSGLDMSPEWLADLAEITRHYWRVRYPDFRQYVYTSKEKIDPTVTKTKEIYLWILNRLNRP